MKRFLFLAVLMSMFAIGNVSAQVISYSQTKVTKLEKERKPVELRQFAGLDFGVYTTSEVNADLMMGAFYEAGVMLNRSIFVGGGLGVGNIFNDQTQGYYEPFGFNAKLYANAKVYITKTKLSTYIDLSVGGQGNKETEYKLSGEDSTFFIDMFVDPQLGLNYHIGRGIKDVFVNVGYGVNCFRGSFAGVVFKVGISF